MRNRIKWLIIKELLKAGKENDKKQEQQRKQGNTRSKVK